MFIRQQNLPDAFVPRALANETTPFNTAGCLTVERDEIVTICRKRGDLQDKSAYLLIYLLAKHHGR